MASGFKDLLAEEFRRIGDLSSAQLDALERHFSLLIKWNQRMNLTRIDRLEAAIRLHYCESLFVGAALPAGRLSIVDVGSGAGFPGLPVAILRPECRVDLVESNRRKAVFLSEAARDFPNAHVIPDRAESLESRYDWLISRAVLPAEVLNLNLAPNAAILMSRDQKHLAPAEIRQVPWTPEHFLGMFRV